MAKKTGKKKNRSRWVKHPRIKHVRWQPGQVAPVAAKQDTPAMKGGSAGEIMSYDESLVERARTQWKFGDWHNLSQINLESLQNHPDRGELALLIATGHLQCNNSEPVRQLIRQAVEWGCSKKFISQILVSGVHNVLGRAEAVGGNYERSLLHFSNAISSVASVSETRLLTSARVNYQYAQLGLSLPAFDGAGNDKRVIAAEGPIHKNERPNKDQQIDSVDTGAKETKTQQRKRRSPKALYFENKNDPIHIDLEATNSIIPNIPDEDFVSGRFDLGSTNPTKDVLVILSTPRSGSTMVCDLLKESGLCLAHEYFQPYQYLPILAARWGAVKNNVIDIDKYVSSLKKYRSYPNGILGINLHGSHIHVFERFAKCLSGLNIHYLHLKRRDLVEQAVSYEIASQTNRWMDSFKPDSEASYDFSAVLRKLKAIEGQNVIANSYMRKSGINYETIVYEDVCRDSVHLADVINRLLGTDIVLTNRSHLKRQYSAINRKWVSLFSRDYFESFSINPSL